MPDQLFGLYRGIVAGTDDPEQRGRYRVRVIGVYAEDSPLDTLPWAEIAVAFAAKDAVDLPHYEVDDRVWVMFEGGDPMYPCLMGGWASWYGDVPDLPPENVDDYNKNRRRWRRQDRKGNTIELSELPDERWVRLQAGNASVTVSQVGDQIRVEADGPVDVKGSSVRVQSGNSSIESDNVSIVSRGKTGGVPDGFIQIVSNDRVVLIGKNTLEIGQYIDGNLVPQQSATVEVQPANLQLGKSNPTDGKLPTSTVIVDGVAVEIGADDGTTVVNVKTQDGGVINVNAGASGTVNITGGAVNIG